MISSARFHVGLRTRRAFHWITLAIVVLVASEILGLAGLGALSKLRGLKYDPISEERLAPRARSRIEALLSGQTTYVVHSPTLGWTLKPGGRTELYRANAQGIRADREYAEAPPPGCLRVAAFGDSFTRSWTARILSAALVAVAIAVPVAIFYLRNRRDLPPPGQLLRSLFGESPPAPARPE